MKAWRNILTQKLLDIQSIPNPLPSAYNPAEWELTDVSEGEILLLSRIAQYKHTERGLQGLLQETPIIITYNLGDLL